MNNRQDLENFLVSLGFVSSGESVFNFTKDGNVYSVRLSYAANKVFLMSINFYDTLANHRLAALNKELEDLKSTYSMTWTSIGHRLDANDRLCSGQNLCYNDWKDKQVWIDNFKHLNWPINLR